MDSIASRKFLERIPDIKNIVEVILKEHQSDIASDDWEIRQVKQPADDTNNGEKVFSKLYIRNQFIINIYPMTDELLSTIKERYNIMQSETVAIVKRTRVTLSRIIQEIASLNYDAGIKYPLGLACNSLILARYWFGQELKRTAGNNPYPKSYNPESLTIEPEADLYETPRPNLNVLNSVNDVIISVKGWRKDLKELSEVNPSGFQHQKAIEYMKEATGWLGMALGTINNSPHAYWKTRIDNFKEKIDAPKWKLDKQPTKEEIEKYKYAVNGNANAPSFNPEFDQSYVDSTKDLSQPKGE